MDFGAGAGLAPDAELRADGCGAFAHSQEAPVRTAVRRQSVRMESGAVVANHDAQLRGREILQLDFDAGGAGMAEGVEQGFAGNPIDLVLNSRVERCGTSEHGDAETRAVGVGKVIAAIEKGLLEAYGSHLR